jgi:hypothetical protein
MTSPAEKPAADAEFQWLTVAKAARRSGHSRSTVYDALNGLNGLHLHGHPNGGKGSTWKIHPDSVDAWVRDKSCDGYEQCCGPKVVKFRKPRRHTG